MKKTFIVTSILAFTVVTLAHAMFAKCDRRIDKVGHGDDAKYVFSNNAGANGSNGGLMNGVATAHADVSGNNHVGHDTQHFSANFVWVWASDTGSYGASATAYFARSGYDSGGTYRYQPAQDFN